MMAGISIFWMVIVVILVLIHPLLGLGSLVFFFCMLPFLHCGIEKSYESLCSERSLRIHNQAQQSPAVGMEQPPVLPPLWQLQAIHTEEAQPTQTPAPPHLMSLLVLRTVHNEDPPVTCVICLEDVQVGDEAAGSLNKDCMHEFHPPCIAQALIHKTTCPSCARKFIHPDDLASAEDPEVPARETVPQHDIREDLGDTGTPAVLPDSPAPSAVPGTELVSSVYEHEENTTMNAWLSHPGMPL